jgi:2-C-methyl-D-erythritol 2,4-cyclodiphosphate synthase
MVGDKKYKLVNMDSTIIAERPKLSPYIPKMRQTLADLLEVGIDCVNVKAKTSEQLGTVGREECIIATVTVLLTPTNI